MFPFDRPEKISVSELWVIFRISPLFLDGSGHSPITCISTLNFGQFSTKLSGTVRAIKEMTQSDNGPGPGQNYGETWYMIHGTWYMTHDTWYMMMMIRYTVEQLHTLEHSIVPRTVIFNYSVWCIFKSRTGHQNHKNMIDATHTTNKQTMQLKFPQWTLQGCIFFPKIDFFINHYLETWFFY